MKMRPNPSPRSRRKISTAATAAVISAMVAGASAVRTARAALAFDNISNAQNGVTNASGTYFVSSPGSTYLGGIYVLPANTANITGFDAFPVNGTSNPIPYIEVNAFFWGGVNTGAISATKPLFNTSLGEISLIVQYSGAGLASGYFGEIEAGQPGAGPGIGLGTPIALSAATMANERIGVTFNFQMSNDGVTFANNAGLTSLITYGTPPSVGSLYRNGFYYAVAGDSNGNFNSSSDGPVGFGYTNQGIAARLYGDNLYDNWNSSSGGTWNPTNSVFNPDTQWTDLDVPSSIIDAIFNLSSPSPGYTVSIPGLSVCNSLYVENDNVTLSFSGSPAALNISNALTVGLNPQGGAANGVLNLSNGVYSGPGTSLNVSSATVNIGGTANGAIGSLIIGTGVNVVSAGATNITNGSLVISANASLTAPSISVASAGVLNVSSGAIVASNTTAGVPSLTDSGMVILSNSAQSFTIFNGSNNGIVNLMGGTALNIMSGGTYAGSILDGGSGGSLQLSGGTLILSGTGNYSGGTLISAGLLKAGAVNALSPYSAFNVAGGTLDVSAYNNTIGSLVIAPTAALNLGYGSILTVTGSATLAGTLNLLNPNNVSAGTLMYPYELMAYNSETGSFAVTNLPAGLSLSYTATELLLIGPSGPANLTWMNNAHTGTWDTVNANWNNGSAIVTYSNNSNGSSGDNVTFNDNNNGSYNVSIVGVVSPSSTTFNNSLGNYVLTGANSSSGIAGTGSLLKLGASSVTLSANDSYLGGTNVSAGKLIFASAAAYPANTPLSISSGATVMFANYSGSKPYVPTLSALTNSGTVDITDNAMIIHNGSIGAITAEVASAYAKGAWTGTNSASGVITSSYAAANTTHLTAVGIATGFTTFEGQAVAAADVLVKYTYYGDANLDGHVDGTDYTRIDNGFALHLTGWYNGDFNYDGVVDGSDYALIDNSYNTQGANLASEVATDSVEIAGISEAGVTASNIGSAVSAVPEPTALGILAAASLGLLRRRQRQSLKAK